jgi:hypothetical protein
MITVSLGGWPAIFAKVKAWTETREPPLRESDSWRDCDEARSAGTVPIYASEPGYREDLDRDRDGIACEPYVG